VFHIFAYSVKFVRLLNEDAADVFRASRKVSTEINIHNASDVEVL
jgi:hypothetical protein